MLKAQRQPYPSPERLEDLARQIHALQGGYRFLPRAHGEKGAGLNLHGVSPGHSSNQWGEAHA